MITKSWTYDRLTEAEKAKIKEILFDVPVKGAYLARWEVLQWVYSAYLDGLGYEPIGWREDCKTA